MENLFYLTFCQVLLQISQQLFCLTVLCISFGRILYFSYFNERNFCLGMYCIFTYVLDFIEYTEYIDWMGVPRGSAVFLICQEVNKMKLVKVGEKGPSTSLQCCHSRCKSALPSCPETQKGKTNDLKLVVHENRRQDIANGLRKCITVVIAIVYHRPVSWVKAFLYFFSICSHCMEWFD